MSFISDRWAIFKEALGASRYGLPNFIRFAVVIIAAIYLYRYGHVMNWVETFGVIGTVTFSILFWVMLEYCLKIIKQIREARVEIAKLRRSGVELRNCGQSRVIDEATYDKWCADTLQWEKDVVAAIAKISVADAEWFAIMDSYPDAPRKPLLKPFAPREKSHRERYEQHDFQLARLRGDDPRLVG